MNGQHVRPAGYFENVERFLQSNIVKKLKVEGDQERDVDDKAAKELKKKVAALRAKQQSSAPVTAGWEELDDE